MKISERRSLVRAGFKKAFLRFYGFIFRML